MFRLKGCPKCKGDLLIDRDHIGRYEQCLQCGYQHDIEPSDKAKAISGNIRYSRWKYSQHGG